MSSAEKYPSRFIISVPEDKLKKILRSERVIPHVEEATGTKISIEKSKSQIIIDVCEETDRWDPMRARDFFRAIILGFKVEEALKILTQDVFLEYIDLKDWAGDSREDLIRLKGRVIGAGGKAKRLISEYTGASIVVGDKYVALLGGFEEIEAARRAIEMLLSGAQHSTVYRFLERERAARKRREILGGEIF